MKVNNFDLRLMLEKDWFIKNIIKKEATYRINFFREETKKAILKLIKKSSEEIVLDQERIEDLNSIFPLKYLSMFEEMSKHKK